MLAPIRFRTKNSALRLDPSDAQVRLGRGLAFLARGQADDARADFEAALALPPGKDGRTRGHVFCCMLALKLYRELERRLTAAFGTTDTDRSTCSHRFRWTGGAEPPVAARL